MTAAEILAKAQEIVNGDRQRDYGSPADNHGCTAALWRAYLGRRLKARGVGLDARDVCILNILQKCSRDANLPKEDNLTDIIGYAINAAMIEDAAKEPKAKV